MTNIANKGFDAPPNVLRGGSMPNTLGGVGPPRAAARIRRPRVPFVAGASVLLAGLAFAFLMWHPA